MPTKKTTKKKKTRAQILREIKSLQQRIERSQRALALTPFEVEEGRSQGGHSLGVGRRALAPPRLLHGCQQRPGIRCVSIPIVLHDQWQQHRAIVPPGQFDGFVR